MWSTNPLRAVEPRDQAAHHVVGVFGNDAVILRLSPLSCSASTRGGPLPSGTTCCRSPWQSSVPHRRATTTRRRPRRRFGPRALLPCLSRLPRRSLR
ncbi:hypothetical protein [Acidimicrobium ferrooxidans]|uniref:hypothetical protein n=1 Tax=Acidimicrobium ferrooxidans TaxID=53635 RepID=UPI003CCB313C